jgi:hypothetical protein
VESAIFLADGTPGGDHTKSHKPRSRRHKPVRRSSISSALGLYRHYRGSAFQGALNRGFHCAALRSTPGYSHHAATAAKPCRLANFANLHSIVPTGAIAFRPFGPVSNLGAESGRADDPRDSRLVALPSQATVLDNAAMADKPKRVQRRFQFSMPRMFVTVAWFCVAAWEFALFDNQQPSLGYSFVLWLVIFAALGAIVGALFTRPAAGAGYAVAFYVVAIGAVILKANLGIDITRDHARILP